jgi:tetratricopeptide (TPR) repeat protein/nitrogen-specific signal transduction histidine kinase
MIKSIYIGNLPYDTNQRELGELFADFGLVYSIKLITDHNTSQFYGDGFVDMATNDANIAIKELNGTYFFGRKLRVNEARRQPPQRLQGQKGHKQKASPEEQFKKEEAELRANLVRSRNNRNKKYELIALNQLGTLCRKHGDYDKAIDYLKQAFKIDPEDGYTLDGLGMIYFKKEEYDQAIEWFQRQLNPIVALTNLSRAYRRKEDYDRAIEHAKRVLRKDPESQIALNELGINYRLKRDYAESISWFNECLEIEPNNKQSMNGLAITYREMGDYQRAIAQFKETLERHPKEKESLDGLAITYREMGNYPQAIACFKEELAWYPDNIHGRDGLGRTYRKMGRYALAIDWFKETLDLYPDNIQSINGLALTYREMGDYEQASTNFKKALANSPKNKYSLNGLAITYCEIGDYEQAIARFQEALALYPENKGLLNGLAITYREMGDYAQAITGFEKILALEPDHEYALKELALTYDKMEPTPQAVELLKHRLFSEPTDSSARSRLRAISENYEADGKLPAAKAIWVFLQDIERPAIFSTAQRKIQPETETESLEDKIKRLEKEIERKEAEVLRSRQMTALGVMASGLAHEIMQPLQIILATARNCQQDILANLIDTPGILEDLEDVAKTTKRIDHIVNHLHLLSRKPKQKMEWVDINTVIKDSFIMFREQLKIHLINIEFNLTDNLPAIEANKIQLEQVFINLINNSRDALANTEDKRINISSDTIDEKIHISFRDSGAGLSPENLPNIFDAFMSTKERGVGLGLYITRDIIHSYGGTIRADSRKDQGTTFLIKLPIVKKEKTE